MRCDLRTAVVTASPDGIPRITSPDVAALMSLCKPVTMADNWSNRQGGRPCQSSNSDDLSAFLDRPNDIERLINFMLGASLVASKIDPRRIGFFGFSRGGYSGLVLIGANPDWT